MGEYLPAVSLGTGAVPVQVHTGMDYVCVLLDGGSVKVRAAVCIVARRALQ